MHQRAILRAVVFVCVTAVSAVGWAGAQARVRGQVVDSAGNPVAGATVMIMAVEKSEHSRRIDVAPDGTFKAIIMDATKHYRFVVGAPGYVPHEHPFKVAAGSSDNTFTFTLITEDEQRAQDRASRDSLPGYRELAEARALLAAGKHTEAGAKLEAAVALVPDLVDGWHGLAQMAYQSGDFKTALGKAERCLEIDDEALPCLAIATNSAKEIGDDVAYQRHSSRYAALNPDDPATIFNRAVEHLNAMDDAAARPILEQCLEVDPDFPKCLFEYGMLLLRSGDIEGAKTKLMRYLAVAPDGPDAATAAETVKYL